MLIDSHCHLPSIKHKKLIETQLRDALEESEVVKVVTIGTSIKDNLKAVQVADAFENVFCTVGIYPNEERKTPLALLQENLQTVLKENKKIVGIGECGLDITEWKSQRPVEQQIELFKLQVELAAKNNLPLIIHNRNGDEQIINILKDYKKTFGADLRGVIHCFTSTWETAQKFIDLGFYISFSGIITYSSGKSIHETVEKVPMDKFVVETDSPYLAPQGHRGEQNQPKYVKITAQKVAEIKGLPFDEVARISTQNASALFGI